MNMQTAIFNPCTISAADIIGMADESHSIGERITLVFNKVARLEHDSAKTAETRADFFMEVMRACDASPSGARRWNTLQSLIRRGIAQAGLTLPPGSMVRRPKSGTYTFPVNLPAIPTESAAPVANPTAPAVADTKGRTATATVNPDAIPDETTAESLARDLLAALQDGAKLPGVLVAELVAALHTAALPVPTEQAETTAAAA